MESFWRDIEEQEAVCTVPADERKLILNNLELKALDIPEVPEEWLMLLKHSNGIWRDGAEIYGVQPNENGFRDMLSVNKDIIWEYIDGGLLLGENEDDLLMFDGRNYFIVDKVDETVWHKTPDVLTAVRFILRV